MHVTMCSRDLSGVQWLRIHLAMQGPWVRSQVAELRSHMLHGKGQHRTRPWGQNHKARLACRRAGGPPRTEDSQTVALWLCDSAPWLLGTAPGLAGTSPPTGLSGGCLRGRTALFCRPRSARCPRTRGSEAGCGAHNPAPVALVTSPIPTSQASRRVLQAICGWGRSGPAKPWGRRGLRASRGLDPAGEPD